jgi:hypothetical protein
MANGGLGIRGNGIPKMSPMSVAFDSGESLNDAEHFISKVEIE